jgi:hypothetical protein
MAWENVGNLRGPQGDQGAQVQGSQGPQGAPGTEWQGAWLPTTAYHVGDLVSHDGTTYIAVADHTSGATFVMAPNWQPFAEAGAAGDQGDQGNQGNQGNPGSAGAQGASMRILGQVPSVPGDIPAEWPAGTPYVPALGDGWLDGAGNLHMWQP